MKNHHFNGTTHYKWAIFNSYVKLPEGKPTVILPKITRNGWDFYTIPNGRFMALGESDMIFVVSLVFTKRQGCTLSVPLKDGIKMNPTSLLRGAQPY